jgi:hypothetical protein
MWITTAWQCISPKVTVQSFKQCCIYNEMDETMMLCIGMTVKRMEMLVSVRKMKALSMKMELLTLIGKGG